MKVSTGIQGRDGTESDSAPAQFFASVFRAFQEAEQTAPGPVERYYTIAGHVIRLRFAGTALLPFVTPALELHAAHSTPSPSLSICIWDSASTSVLMSPPPWTREDYSNRGEIRGYGNERIHTAFQLGPDILSVLDLRENVAVLWAARAEEFSTYERSMPVRTILHWWMRSQGIQLVHAGAVGTEDGGVLLTGKGGSGKSTSALACLQAGMRYAGDDYVLLGLHGGPYVHSLYSTGKLDGEHVKRFPRLLKCIENPSRLSSEKALVFLPGLFPEGMSAGFPVRAILVPKVTGGRKTVMRRISAVEGLSALAPTTIRQLAWADETDFQFMARFAKSVPSFRMELGEDIAGIPDAVMTLLEDLEAGE
jgi:hypothetical protein